VTRRPESLSRVLSRERAEEFAACGYERRHFFPHRVYHLPKCGPDAFRLAGWMCGVDDPGAMWEIVLYAQPEVLAEFPPDLFFDDAVNWHQQQFGLPGQVATASLVLTGGTVHSITHVSDLVQRIGRRREHKTRIEKVLKGWNHMLLNAVLEFACEHEARHVRIPAAALAGRHTDRSRKVDLAIFERIYDRTVNSVFSPRAEGEWWVLNVETVRGRIVVPERRLEARAATTAVCICHEVERGLGHRDIEPPFARQADRSSEAALAAMRKIEADLGLRATYCVVGSLLDGLHAELKAERHCVAFHSFDHRLDRDDQLVRCREADYRIKGYRPPWSRITAELTDRNLLFHNFEWLASSGKLLGIDAPELRNGLVRIPIALDDFPLHRGAMSFGDWEQRALQLISDRDFVAISLHDCYAPLWLDRYRDFLRQVAALGELRTLDEVAAEVTLDGAV
jgi:hypothetical protein